MYFAQGWPKVFDIYQTNNNNASYPLSSLFVDIKCNSQGNLVATLSESQVVIWSGDQVYLFLQRILKLPRLFVIIIIVWIL